jgi:hypothetical protein
VITHYEAAGYINLHRVYALLKAFNLTESGGTSAEVAVMAMEQQPLVNYKQ